MNPITATFDTSDSSFIPRVAVPAEAATPASSFSGNRNELVKFRHPGYSDAYDQNVFLSLHAFDRAGGGIHYNTALVACAIVAGNAWEGYFTTQRQGEKIVAGDDDILLGRSYYFHLPSFPPVADPYPLYLAFEHWYFPHDSLPPGWAALVPDVDDAVIGNDTVLAPPSASNLTSAILRRDGSCRVTNSRDYIETAHLCPRKEAAWFEANEMGQYSDNEALSGPWVTDDVSNAIALRSDLHTAFDDRKFVLVPKGSCWVPHFLSLTNDLGRLYHNTSLKLDKGVSRCFLLARFAWAIFPLIQKFMLRGVARCVRIRVPDGKNFEEKLMTLSREEIQQLAALTQGGSTSPKKRKTATDWVPAPAAVTKKQRRSSSLTYRKILDSYNSSCPLSQEAGRSPCPLSREGGISVDSATTASSLSLPSHKLKPASPTDRALSLDLPADRREWVRRRRPSNLDLYCCDYNAAEAAVKAGIPGKREHGGSHLCLECLGVEYRDDEEGA